MRIRREITAKAANIPDKERGVTRSSSKAKCQSPLHNGICQNRKITALQCSNRLQAVTMNANIFLGGKITGCTNL